MFEYSLDEAKGGCMKAAVMASEGSTPIYADFEEPSGDGRSTLVAVSAAALSQFTRSRASGSHYSSEGASAAIVGADGVGVTSDGRRVYFFLPEAPYGAMAQMTKVETERCIPLPDDVDDLTAAAIAIPGMSSWAALTLRARLQPGETVLINGATGVAGRLAVQIAKHLGASKVIATGRDEAALEEVRSLGADAVVPFKLGPEHPQGVEAYEAALSEHFNTGVDVVIDYLWGTSARTIIAAIARTVESAIPVRYVEVGGASGEDVELPGAALRSSAIVLMGSGIKSIPLAGLITSMRSVFDAIIPAGLRINTRQVPLSQIATAWTSKGDRSRIVVVMR
jgi:NADPH:quinone reductase-like Zn-dependent oxidoreductase